MFIAAICFAVGAFFCSCTSQYTHRKNALYTSHLIRSESLLPNPIGGFRSKRDREDSFAALFLIRIQQAYGYPYRTLMEREFQLNARLIRH